MPGGRPTKYDSKFCEMLIEHMSEGLSFESFGGVIDVCKDTLYEWAKKHKEFSDAHRLGVSKSRLWWEKQGTKGLFTESWQNGKTGGSKAMNSAVYRLHMANRFGWYESKQKEVRAEKEVKKVIIKMDDDE